MKKVLSIALSLCSALCLCALGVTPHAKIRTLWVNAHNMTDSANFSHNLNNPRFYLANEEGLPSDSVEYGIELSGVDSDWIIPVGGDWHFYSDLDPGNYTFKTRCRLRGGEWGPEFSHSFTIHRPWWRSTIAITSFIIIVAVILIYIAYLLRARIKIRNQLLVERKNQQFKNELVLHASRQFRVPLSIIKSIIEKLKTEEDRLTATDIRHLRTSSRSLMLMVEQLAGYGEPADDSSLPEYEVDDICEENTPPPC